MAKTEADFIPPIRRMMREAQAASLSSVDVTAGDVHTEAGDYPGSDHRMPICCRVMKNEMRSGDRIIESPPSGQGASLKIRYQLPRR
jgi:5-methylcytosine-specific restriction protein A